MPNLLAAFFRATLILSLSSAGLAVTTHYRVDSLIDTWYLHTDKTYEEDIVQKITPLTKAGVSALANTQMSFFPDKDKLQLLEAYVVQADGTRVPVPAASIYTRPTPLSVTASGFTNSLMTTVVFSQLKPGSQTVVHWKKTHFKSDDFGINIINYPTFSGAVTDEEIIIHKPNALSLQWGKRGDYTVTTEQKKDELIIQASLQNKIAESEETSMSSEEDFQSLFAATTLSSWKEMGRIYYQLSKNKGAITPQIRALAKEIVGDKTGLAAAQAIYNWTQKNIHYISLGLNEASGYTPHSAAEVLNARYGDCKDYSILLQALFKAAGIPCYTALIHWGGLFTPPPVPVASQFNHAIVYLPTYHLFVNSTGETASFGVLDTGLTNKMAMIASEKGAIAYTPLSKPTDNEYTLDNDIMLDDQGNILGKSTLQSTGIINNTAREVIRQSVSMQKLAEVLLSSTPEGGTGTIDSSDPDDLDHDMAIHTTWRSPSAVVMHQYVYMNTPYGIDLMLPSHFRKMMIYDKRHYPALIPGETAATWHYTLHLPSHYSLDSLPVPVSLNNTAGHYESTYRSEKNIVEVTRKLIINRSYYRAEEYEDLNQLLQATANDAKNIIVLKKAS